MKEDNDDQLLFNIDNELESRINGDTESTENVQKSEVFHDNIDEILESGFDSDHDDGNPEVDSFFDESEKNNENDNVGMALDDLASDATEIQKHQEGDEPFQYEFASDIINSEVNANNQEAELFLSARRSQTEVYTPSDFTIKGSRSWNTREPYVVNVDTMRLQKDYDDLVMSFYFIEDIGKGSSIQGEIRRALIRYHSGKHDGIVEEYTEFINKTIVSQMNELSSFFDFEEDKKNLFIYHLGVLSFYKIIISLFQGKEIGYCFKLLNGNRVVKNLPAEYVKEVTLKWYEENINTLNIYFDGIQEYNEIKQIISRRYHSEVNLYDIKLNETIRGLDQSQKKRIKRDEFYRSKWNEWYGRLNIIVYNRFLERTIFKAVVRYS